MTNERMIRTFILAIVGLALFAWLRPASLEPMYNVVAAKTGFFINKIHSPQTYDMVVMGDSRALRGISPEEMQTILEDRSILNYAFHAGGLNNEMFDAAERRLDPASKNRTVLLAVTSLSLLPLKEANEQYREYLAKPADQVQLYRHAPELANLFQPMEPSIFIRNMLSLKPLLMLEQEFHDSGWIASNRYPNDVSEDLEGYGYKIRQYHLVDRLIDDCLTRTDRWVEQGIEVYAFIMPSEPARVALEDSILGFDRGAFIAGFEAAGGVWLDIDDQGYQVYDGSHLDVASARKLSRVLANALKSRN
jgi:hypothetical protein